MRQIGWSLARQSPGLGLQRDAKAVSNTMLLRQCVGFVRSFALLHCGMGSPTDQTAIRAP
jgi:hypothetical protein